MGGLLMSFSGIDYTAITNQCIKGFGKVRGRKIGDNIHLIANLSFIAADGLYVYALFDIGRKTRKKGAVKDLTDANKALNEIIKTAKELQAEISTELERLI
jgi:hypothetical protein